MILYVNGDSHSEGRGAGNKTFAQLIANHYNFTLQNQARGGASNARILRTTEEFLKDNHPELVVIGWSTWEREEWLYNDQYYDVNSSGHTGLPEELIDQYKQWVTQQSADEIDNKSRQLHEKIYQLHKVLEQRKISHIFFTCMYNFFSIKQEYDWNNSFINPYINASSYFWYLKNRGFQTDKWYHFGEDGHAAWGNFLINYIDKYKIL